jgi:hypothetical protein
MNVEYVAAGFILIVFGFFFGWLICFGWAFIPIGLVLVFIGLVTEEEKKNGAIVQNRQPLGAPGTANFCPYCGRQIASGAAYCPGCGRTL